jgi:hypothetical protein
MAKCSDPETGALIHAYELNALPEEEKERFEIHFLTCQYCLNELEGFEHEAAVMNHDREVRTAVREAAVETSVATESLGARIRQYLWPDVPVLFKPALAYIAVLLLALPAFHGLTRLKGPEVEPVQSIALTPMRSGPDKAIQMIPGTDILVSFVFEDVREGGLYQVNLASETGDIIYADNAFSGFDHFGQGHLIWPKEKITPGRYLLSIIDPEGTPPLNRREYVFNVE